MYADDKVLNEEPFYPNISKREVDRDMQFCSIPYIFKKSRNVHVLMFTN